MLFSMGILDQAPEEFEYTDYRPMLNRSVVRLGTLVAARAKRLMKKPMKTPKIPKGGKPPVPPKPAHLRVKGGKKVGKKTSVNQPAFGQKGGEDLPMYSRGAGPSPAYSPKVPKSRVKPGIPGKSPAAVTAAQGKPPGYSPAVPKKSAGAKAKQKSIVDAQPKQGALKRVGGVENLSKPPPVPASRMKPAVGKSPAKIRKEKLKTALNASSPAPGALKRSKGFSDKMNVATKRKAPPLPPKLSPNQQMRRVKNVGQMEAFQREAAKTYKAMPKKKK